VNLKNSATEIVRLLTNIYENEVVSQLHVFKWHKRFRENREEVDDLRPR